VASNKESVIGGRLVVPFRLTLFIVMLVVGGSAAIAKKTSHESESIRTPTVGNTAIDTLDMEWWDDDKTLLFIDVTFNFPVSVTTEISDKAQKTHILQLISTGSVAKSYKHSYRGSEHHAISKKFRDIVEEIRYEGNKGGKSELLVYLYEPAVLNYQIYNNFRTLHLEVSRIQRPKPLIKPSP